MRPSAASATALPPASCLPLTSFARASIALLPSIRRSMRSTLLTRSGRCLAPRPWIGAAPRGARWDPWQACRSRSRTTSTSAGCGPLLPPGSSSVLCRLTTPPSSGISKTRGRSSSARRTVTSSRWGRRPRTLHSARSAIRGHSIASLADRAAARPRPWRPVVCRSRWDPIPAGRFDSLRLFAASSDSSRPTAASRGTACWRSRRRSIRSVRSRVPWPMQPSCCRRSPVPTRATRRRLMSPSPISHGRSQAMSKACVSASPALS